MTTLYLLDIPENTPVVTIAAADPAVTVDRIGPYFQLHAENSIAIDRRATGCRHAVWYSCVAATARDSTISQHDKNALVVVPA
jgi:hypothetical protein